MSVKTEQVEQTTKLPCLKALNSPVGVEVTRLKLKKR
jgi:hypothetical protein